MGKPKSIKPPPPPAPAPTVEETTPTEEQTVRQQRRKSGYQRTLLTGALSPTTGKKTVLG